MFLQGRIYVYERIFDQGKIAYFNIRIQVARKVVMIRVRVLYTLAIAIEWINCSK